MRNDTMAHPYNDDIAAVERCGSQLRKMSSATASDRETTTLEKCRNQAMNNMYAINDLGSRVAALLERLRGPQLTGGSGSEGDSEPRGMLVVHLEQLEYEGQRLGEIQADLALLEQLL